MAYSEINTIRKAGRLDEALARAEYEYAANPNRSSATALFWCLNDDSKRLGGDEAHVVVDRMEQLLQDYDPTNEMMNRVLAIAKRMLQPESKHEIPGWEIYHELRNIDITNIDDRKHLLDKYINLDLERPSLLHSLILTEALKMEKCNNGVFSFTKFAENWGFDKFRDEDWEQRLNKEGQRLPSNVERVIGCCIREMHESGETPGQGFCLLLDKAIENFPRNNHLPRYAAQILSRQGHKQEAIDTYKQLILKSPEKFYLWDDLSELVDDTDLQLGLLCGAVTSGAHDEFLVNIRLRMADILCNMRLYPNALTELDRYERAHQFKGWPLKRRYYNVANRVPKGTMPADNRNLYTDFRLLAEEFLYSDLPTALMVKSWEKKENMGNKAVISWMLRHNEDTLWMRPRQFHLDFSTPNGTVFEVKSYNGQVVWIQPTKLDEDLPWLRRVTGPLKIKRPASGKLFGFVEEVFVPAQLLYSYEDGTMATVLAIQNSGNKWAALSIE